MDNAENISVKLECADYETYKATNSEGLASFPGQPYENSPYTISLHDTTGESRQVILSEANPTVTENFEIQIAPISFPWWYLLIIFAGSLSIGYIITKKR